MTAEIVNSTDGPQIEVHFQTQAEYVAWRWLCSQAKDNCLLTIIKGKEDDDLRMTRRIGPYQKLGVIHQKGTIVVGKTK